MVNTLEETEEMAKAIAASTHYQPINPEESYSRNYYLFHHKNLQDLIEYREKLTKDPFDPSARKDLSVLLFGRNNPNALANKQPDFIRKAIKESYDDGTDKMAKFARKNLQSILDLYNPQGLVNLALQIPLYTVNESQHDSDVQLIREVNEIQQITKDKNLNAMRKVVVGHAKKYYAKWLQNLIGAYAVALDSFVQEEFGQIAQEKNARLNGTFVKDNKIDTDRLKNLILTSINEAEKAWDDEEDEGDKSEVWKNDLKPAYLAIAQAPYQSLKLEADTEVKFESDRIKRAKERHEKGMPF